MHSGTRGIIISWFDEKGYGFIEPAGGGARLFFHIRAVRNSDRRDLLGHRVTYVVGEGKDGRPAATEVYLAVEAHTPVARRRPRQRTFRSATLLACLVSFSFLGAIAWFSSGGSLHWGVLILYVGMSLFTYAAYRRDKALAGTGFWRTPESTLHMYELFGGWPGALIAQWAIGHKNRKTSYQVGFWLIVIIHLAALGFYTLDRTAPALATSERIIMEFPSRHLTPGHGANGKRHRPDAHQ